MREIQVKMRKRKKFYRRKSKKNKELTIVGIVRKSRKGFGFIDMPADHIFISSDRMKGAMNGDMVEVELLPQHFWRDKNPEGVVVRIKKHAIREVVGVFQNNKGFGFVVPDNRNVYEDIFISKKNFAGAVDGDLVVCEITKYPDGKSKGEGKIRAIVAKAEAPDSDIKSLICRYGVNPKFESEISAEARKIQSKGITAEDILKRVDLRNLNVFTIDGADSKDFDDAVSISKNREGNLVLGVHIADVSHYVNDGSILDKEAFLRGNSIYLIDTVIPMLPRELSNDICSLNPGVDRLTLSCEMEIDNKGRVVDSKIFESVIKSCERLVYDDISDLLENGDEDFAKRYERILPDLEMMKELKNILSFNKKARGSINFDIDEAKIKLNAKGEAIDVRVAERRFANEMIEEFMLLANETVARSYFNKVPFVYRVHEEPDLEKMTVLRDFLSGMGFVLPTGKVTPKDLSDILNKIEGSKNEQIIRNVMLHTMQRAVYSPECLGHFGLALKYYCHFTSPIRRYADLVVHRLIKECIRKEKKKEEFSTKNIKYFKHKVEEASNQTSATERKAIELEREVERVKKAEYMSKHIGEKFNGIISGITAYGLYVRLPNTIEGLVRIDEMYDDYFEYDEAGYRLIGRDTNRTYTLGDEVFVEVYDVNIKRGEVDFVL